MTEFPLVEYDEDAKRWGAMHHPFTSPREADLGAMFDDPGAVRARAYDLVLNGSEIGGGSIRIHRAEIQRQMFTLLGIAPDEAPLPWVVVSAPVVTHTRHGFRSRRPGNPARLQRLAAQFPGARFSGAKKNPRRGFWPARSRAGTRV